MICGHVHHAAIHEHFGVRYINCGDWIESCTAVAEHSDGAFEILEWMDRHQTERGIRCQNAHAGRRSGLMRILVATDAWHPQVNGVVRTLSTLAAAVRSHGARSHF